MLIRAVMFLATIMVVVPMLGAVSHHAHADGCAFKGRSGNSMGIGCSRSKQRPAPKAAPPQSKTGPSKPTSGGRSKPDVSRGCYDEVYQNGKKLLCVRLNEQEPASRPPSPEQVAAQAVASMDFPVPTINYGPVPDPMSEFPGHYIGVPYWYWTDNTAGPRSLSNTEQGITIELYADAPAVVWDMGDGTVLACGPGTPWGAVSGQESPTCGHRYQYPGQYTITVTATWQVQWSGMGQSGTVEMSTTNTLGPISYGEIHTFLVEPHTTGG